MKRFTKQFRDLPWAKPSVGLRQTLFGEVGPASSFRRYRLFSYTVGKAALWLLIGSLIGYGLGRGQNTSGVSALPSDDVTVVVTGPGTRFFSQTDDMYDAIPGPWILSVEPEGGTQG